MQFRWKDEDEELELVHSTEPNITVLQYMCHVEQNDAVLLSCWSPDQVCAVNLSDGTTLWELNQQINREDIVTCGLCHDTDGRIYMPVEEAGVITIEGRTGKLLQHLIKDVEFCYDIIWINSQPQPTVFHAVGQEISTFNICRI